MWNHIKEYWLRYYIGSILGINFAWLATKAFNPMWIALPPALFLLFYFGMLVYALRS